MPMVSADQLRRLCPRAEPAIIAAIADQADVVLTKWQITTRNRLCHLLTHVAVETDYLTRLDENLFYTAARIHAVWPHRFPTIDSAQAFAGKPEALANKVYGGQYGNVGPNDGWTYRGQGGLNTTFRDNFARLGKMIGVDLVGNPDKLTAPETMLECAAASFVMLGALPHADKDDILSTTRCVTGANSALAERQQMLARAKGIFLQVLPPRAAPVAPSPVKRPVVPIVPPPAAPAPVPVPGFWDRLCQSWAASQG